MAADNETWKQEVREQLVEVFGGNDEDLSRILFFLDEEDKAYKDNTERPYAPHWKSLKAMVRMERAFREYALKLSEETKKANTDQQYREYLGTLYEDMMTPCDDTVAIEAYQEFDTGKLRDKRVLVPAAFGSLARVWDVIPAQRKISMIHSFQTIARQSRVLSTAVDEIANIALKGSGTYVMVALAAVCLGGSAMYNIHRWWKGEISGERCKKNVLDVTFITGAGMAGGSVGAVAGAAVGAALGGPVTTVVALAGVVGGVISAAGMAYLSDYLTQWLFGLPKDEALENAYRYLGVKMTATNAQINTAFRQLCLKHHPDKGGKNEDFFILQNYMATIKEARGDYY